MMEDKELIKNALLETMDEFHAFCERHDLTYYLVGGGLIGAIRHKGFIPWDDDLDVIMPRKDYKKLLALHSKFIKPLKLEHYTLNNNYYRCCAALVNESLMVDTGSYKNAITGVPLDILCLFPTFKNKALLNIHFKTVKFFRGLLIIKGKTFLRNNHNKYTYIMLSSMSYFMKVVPKRFITSTLNLFENISLFNRANLANLHGAWGTKEIADSEMLSNRQLYEFDGRQYWSMTYKNADKWLTNVYGNYMKLPPERERVYRHIDKIVNRDNNI